MGTRVPSLPLYPHTHHIVTPKFVDRPRWSDCTSGHIDGEDDWWEDQTHPTGIMGSQQHG